MERYEKPKCTHAIILHSFPMIKSLPKVSILYPFGPLMNFQIYTWDSLPFKPISHLTMVCYHQNLIRRILGLTVSPFFIMINLGYLGEEKISPLNQSWINQSKFMNSNQDNQDMRIFNRKQCKSWKHISYHIYGKIKCTRNIDIWNRYDNDLHVGLLDPKYLSPFGNIKNKRRGSPWIKAEEVEVEVETRSGGKPSSPHADSLGDSQCDQASVGDAQM